MTSRVLAFLALASLAPLGGAAAQEHRSGGHAGQTQAGHQGQADHHALLQHHIFPPEFIMQHQQAIGLTEAQRNSISEALLQMHRRIMEAQWDLQAQHQALGRMLDSNRVNLSAALAQMDRVLEREREVKRTHMETLITIKNALSAEQQAQLRRLREEMEKRR